MLRLRPISLLFVALFAAIAACGGAEEAVVSAPAETAATTATTVVETTTEAPTTTVAPATTASPTTTTTAASTTEAPTTTEALEPIPLYLVDSYDPARDPFVDVADAVDLAGARGKQVIAIVGGDWCPDCIVIDQFIADRPELHDSLAEQFALVKVNLSEENENRTWWEQYPAFEWVPHFYVFDGDGALVDSYDTRGLMRDGRFQDDLFEQFIAERS